MLSPSVILALLISISPADNVLEGCTAHFGKDDGTTERVVPCATSTEIATDLPLVWLERDGAITAYQSDVEEGELRLPLLTGAKLRIHETIPHARRTIVIVQSIEEERAFIRRVNTDAVTLVPPGRAIVVSLDQHSNILAVSAPQRAVVGRVTSYSTSLSELPLVYAGLDWPHRGDTDEMTLSLEADGNQFLPFMTLHTARGVTGIWYDVPGRRATLTALGAALWAMPQEITLRPKQVSTVRAALRPLPAVTAVVETDSDELDPLLEKARLALLDAATRTTMTDVPLTGRREHRFERVKPGTYTVTLVLPDWTIARRADTSKGDAHVSIAVEPFTIKGVVTRGGEPIPATVTFRDGRNAATVSVNDAGEYALRVWQAGRYQAEILQSGLGNAIPHIEMVHVREDRALSWDLPDNDYTIQVINAATREPIGGATVAVTSSWQYTNGERRTVRHVRTDESGEVTLPPLYPGVLELQASADGFMTGATSTVAVSEHQHDPMKVLLELRAEEQSEKLAITLSDGTPAVGADVVGLSTLQGDVIWRDTVDPAGIVSIPSRIPIIAVRHPRAGCSVRESTGRPGGDIWTLPPPTPLALRAVDRKDQGVRGARVVIWVDGFRLTGPLLGFLTGSAPLTDRTGLWMAKNLPAQPIRVLFLGPDVDWATSERGAFDGRAVTVRPPLQTTQNVLVFE